MLAGLATRERARGHGDGPPLVRRAALGKAGRSKPESANGHATDALPSVSSGNSTAANGSFSFLTWRGWGGGKNLTKPKKL